MISVLIVLFVAFGVFFPSFSYKSKWDEALILLKNRDIILTIDRIGKLYDYSFSPSNLQNFLDTLIPVNETGMISWSETEGTIKNEIKLACNCTPDQMRTLSIWTRGLKVNGREIIISPVSTPLDNIQTSDVLLIWGRKDLSNYVTQLRDYLKGENGIVEVADFRTDGEVNSAQQQIFGLKFVDRIKGMADYDQFARKPNNSTDITYGPYKNFYHVPIPLKATPSTVSIAGCRYSPSNSGNLTFGQTRYGFWICDDASVWFDTDADGAHDTKVTVGKEFKIAGYNFTLSYVDDNKQIGVSFEPTFRFSDFLYAIVPPGEPDPNGWAWGTKGSVHIEPVDGNSEKVLINAVFSSPPRIFPVVILNSTKVGRTAWMPEFADDTVGDDQKLLLISLLLWASNKRAVSVLSPNLKVGYINSYINAVNGDMFEVYNFNLGLGYPYY